MASETRAARLADEFAASYPPNLAERLEWLSTRLDIDRRHFLRLMGLTLDEVEEYLTPTWQVIAERWEDEAWWVEDLLCQLIAFFGYDWRTLRNRLRQPVTEGGRPEPERVVRPAGHVARLHTLPPADREKTLLTLIAQGGPDVLIWLLEYLTQPTGEEPSSRTRH